jgi:hypothetical protein
MLDINGQELHDGDTVQLLCEIVAIDGDDNDGVRLRILNSELELLITADDDEVLGRVASSELMKLNVARHPEAVKEAAELGFDSQADGVKLGTME